MAYFVTGATGFVGGVTYWGDNSKATRELGLEHRPPDEGLEETLREAREALDA